MPGGEPERGHRPHRVAHQVEGPEAERVGEGFEVVDQPLGAEALGGVPARPAVAARVGEVEPERLRESRDLGAEVSRPDELAPWSRTSGGPLPTTS